MKSLGKKGFTLIELLAVITIMGILMLVAIPAVSRTIENSRRDTFADNVKTYINTVRNAVLADELKCGATGAEVTVSSLPDGIYYYEIDTTAAGTKDLMEKVATSSWGGADIEGYVKWIKKDGKTSYYAFMTDKSLHGMNAEAAEDSITRTSINSTVEEAKKAPKTPAKKTGESDPIKCVLKQ